MDEALSEHLALVAHVEELLPQIEEIAAEVIGIYDGGGRVYTFGNGGSSCEAQHFAEELVARYRRDRRPLPASSLSSDAAVLTCIANDFSFEDVFARQVEAFVGRGDMVIAFSTSGRSENVVRGLSAARAAGATTVLFGGGDGLPAASHADYALVLPSSSTARVQELHVLLLHLIVDRVDAWAAGTA
jgi:D-sedoheptulose 7-phosphate isomerase